MSDIAALQDAEKAQTEARREEAALIAKGKLLHETEPERFKRLGYDVKQGLRRAQMEKLCHGPDAEYLVFHQVEDRSTPEYDMLYDVRSIDPVKAPKPAPRKGKGGKGKKAEQGAEQAPELQADADIE